MKKHKAKFLSKPRKEVRDNPVDRDSSSGVRHQQVHHQLLPVPLRQNHHRFHRVPALFLRLRPRFVALFLVLGK